MIEKITFPAAYEFEDKTVELERLNGPYWHIYIDRYYFGQVLFRDGKWEAVLQNEGTLEPTDLDVIEDLITEYENNRNAKKP